MADWLREPRRALFGATGVLAVVLASPPPGSGQTPSQPPTPTPSCVPVQQADLDFDFSIDPPRPFVGDQAELTVRMTNTTAGLFGLPQYNLSGTSPLFTGDVAPRSSSQGPSDQTYLLVATTPGSAAIRMTVNYETAVGCRDSPVFQFATETAEPFLVDVACAGDCDMDGVVTVAELIRAVNVALGRLTPPDCMDADVDADGRVSIAELVRAVTAALAACASASSPGVFAIAPAQVVTGGQFQKRFTECRTDFDLTISNVGPPGSLIEIRDINLWHGYSQGDYSTGFVWDLSGLELPASLASGESLTIPISFDAAQQMFSSRLHVAINPTRPGDFGEVHAIYWGPSAGDCED